MSRRAWAWGLSLAIAFWVGVAMLAGAASAHTGNIVATQDCTGWTITARLNSDVAESATWVLELNATVLATGSGPGPAEIGPYTGPVTTGSATLRITYRDELNTYSASLPVPGVCATPTPTPSPTPTSTPTPTPTPISEVMPSPTPTATPIPPPPIPTPTPTPSPTPIPTPSPSPSPSASPMPSAFVPPSEAATAQITAPPTTTSESGPDHTSNDAVIVFFLMLAAIGLLVGTLPVKGRRR